MMIEKKTLTLDDIDTLTALELPSRETPQVVVVINCLAVCIGEIRLRVEDINAAAQVCAQVLDIAVEGNNAFDCRVAQ